MSKIFFITLLFFSFTAFSQQPRIKELEKKLTTAKDQEKLSVLNELSEIYLKIYVDKAIEYAEDGLKLLKKNKNDAIEANLYNILGEAYYTKKKFRKATKNYENELMVRKKSSNKEIILRCLYNVGSSYIEMGKTNEAIEKFSECKNLAFELKDTIIVLKAYNVLYSLYTQKNDYENALRNYEGWVKNTQSIQQLTHQEKITNLTKYYEGQQKVSNDTIKKLNSVVAEVVVESDAKISKKKSEIDSITRQKKNQEEINAQQREKNEELKKRFMIIIILLSFVLFFLMLFVLQFIEKKRANRELAKKNEDLENALNQLNNAYSELSTQKQHIDEIHRQLTENLGYAQQIQKAFLATIEDIQKDLPESFIIFQPREMVSGDFYWYASLDDVNIIAAGDCTGHGYSAAFMSIIGMDVLREIVLEKHIVKPDEILSLLHEKIIEILHQNKISSVIDDGMDIAIVAVNKQKRILQYAGAMCNLYIVHNGVLSTVKADFNSIGGKPLRETDIQAFRFKCHEIEVEPDTTIYLSSDGFIDQFGGQDNTKFNIPRFKQMLCDHHTNYISNQREIFLDTFMKWKGTSKQMDDVMVIGIKIC